MKEFKFNLRYLLVKKELYFCIIGVLLINALHVLLVINHYAPTAMLGTSEYQFILYNPTVNIMTILILAFPILHSLVLADSHWLESRNGIQLLLYPRLHTKRNIWIRLLLSIGVTFSICLIGFLLNYLSFYFIMGSGNVLVHIQSLPYSLSTFEGFFLDGIRYQNPVIFITLISLHISFIFGLLAGISFSLSFFIKQRIVIYFQVLLTIIISEVVLSFLDMGKFSIIKQLQPFSKFSFIDSLILYTILLLLCIIPIIYFMRKKDTL